MARTGVSGTSYLDSNPSPATNFGGSKMKKFLLIGIVFVALGCKSPSMNVQRSSLRAVGDVAATIVLEGIDADKVESSRAEALDLIDSIEKFLDDGTVPEMAVTALRDLIKEKVPLKYSAIADTLLAYIPTTNVPTEKLGVNNLKRVQAACYGLKVGFTKYDVVDRNTK